MNNDDARKILDKKSKLANSRLLSLERGIDVSKDSYAYRKAETYLDNREKIRFRSNQKMTDKEVRKELFAIESFLSSESSSLRGAKKIKQVKMSRLANQLISNKEKEYILELSLKKRTDIAREKFYTKSITLLEKKILEERKEDIEKLYKDLYDFNKDKENNTYSSSNEIIEYYNDNFNKRRG